jgi:uncharacterized membrane protein YeaQ/YmgE (transglycosylase-associated protein family)
VWLGGNKFAEPAGCGADHAMELILGEQSDSRESVDKQGAERQGRGKWPAAIRSIPVVPQHANRGRNRSNAQTGAKTMPIDVQSLIILLVIGAIAGWLAGQVVKGYGFGLIGNIVVGVIGAYIGQALFPAFGFWGTDLVGIIISATLGAIILLLVIGLLRRIF